MKYLTFILICFFSVGMNAQSLDEELGFIYVKADYLLQTDRYEEAIQEFNKIVLKDPAFKDCLYKRATAKYALAAYKGVKKDLLQSFEVVGVTPESLLLFGEAQEAEGDEGAPNTLKTASYIYPDHRKAGKYKDEEVVKEEEERKSTEDTIKEEVKKIEDKISSILEDLLPDNGSNSDDPSDDAPTQDTESGDDSESEVIVEKPQEKIYIPDNSVNEIYVDEDLTLEIKNGLGNRKILDQPNILILSENSGNVAVDICVNKNGKVTSAEFNGGSSSINTQSLISLAVRKSKEFWFEKSDRRETCGTIVFIISGRA